MACFNSSSVTPRDLKLSLKLLPEGSSVTLSREALLAALEECDAPAVPPQEPSRLLTAEEVALRLGVSRKYVYSRGKTWPFRRKLPGEKALRFESAGLERWLARQT